ncbi:MAG: ABC transporter ATP-binding protein [Candidatus Xenobia bacterium]
MIELKELRVDYEDVCAVKDLTLSVGAGEIYGLIGPNGAGKTSTMRAIMGLQEPTYGDILLNRVDLGLHREEALRNVGFMPDVSPLYEDLTVFEILDLFAASYGVPRDQRAGRIAKYLELTDLLDKRDAMTVGLSRGMKQRVMLARTLLSEPAILLLDEPASGMDPMGRAMLKELMRRLAAEGRTVLISSHILSELSEFCTSVGIMEKGRMVMSGSVESITTSVLGQSPIVVEVVSGIERFTDVLAQNSRVGKVVQDGHVFSFPFDGGAEDAGELLAALVGGGIRVCSFGRKKESLEDVFLKVGAREVS